jgi:cytochrome P460
MSKNLRNIQICILAMWLAGAVTLMASSPSINKKALMVEEVSGYKSWTKVNPLPLRLPTPLDGLCRMPTADDLIQTSSNPHRQKYFTVYVNDVGRSAMMHKAKPEFPKGTVIVKEKLLAKDSDSPELLTVMVKHGRGFNPTSGDWEYMVLNGSGTKVEGRGQLERCQSCHLLKKQSDYVFRGYLPSDVQRGSQ